MSLPKKFLTRQDFRETGFKYEGLSFLDASWFGVVADGVTNATPTLQRAVDAAAGGAPPDRFISNHGVIRLPAGVIRLDAPLVIPQGITLYGQGRTRTIIRYFGDSGFALDYFGLSSADFAFGGGLRHAMIQCDVTGGSAVRLRGTRSVVVDDVAVMGQGSASPAQKRAPYGFRLEPNGSTGCTNNIILNTHIEAVNTAGISCDGTVSGGFVTRNFFHNLHIRNCVEAMQFFDSGTNQGVHVSVSDCDDGIRLEQASRFQWLHAFIENSTNNDVIIDATSTDNVILGSRTIAKTSDATAGQTVYYDKFQLDAGLNMEMIVGHLGLRTSTTVSNTLGSVVRRQEVFDAAGNSLGFIPIYDSIT